MKLYVGNLSSDVKEDQLKEAFEAFGDVASAVIIRDKYSDESRGFGFVEMRSEPEAQAAIAGLNGKEWMGRVLTVNEAHPRPQFRQDGFRKGESRHPDFRKRGKKRRDGRRHPK